MILADALSRAGFASELEDRPRILNVDAYTSIPDARLDEVRAATEADFNMKQLILFILNGWPTRKSDVPETIRQYFDFRDVMGYHDGIVLKGEAVTIPESLRNDMKARLHKSHLATESMLRRAKDIIFWPGMSKDIQKIADNCEACMANKPNNVREPLKQHTEGGPWDKIGVDLCEVSGRQYLVTVDYHSNFIEVDYLTTTTSGRVIGCLKKTFARFGIPKTIVSDGGPQFSAREFAKFAKSWGINHVMSSPHYPKSNGKAESAVKIVKNIITKCVHDNSDQYEALLEQRNTPRQDTGLSPSEMLLGRKMRTMLPQVQPDTRETSFNEAQHKRTKRRSGVKRCYDRKCRNLPKLLGGQNVYFQKLPNSKWTPGVISSELRDRSYELQANNGTIYRRNRVHIRPTDMEIQVRDDIVDPLPTIAPEIPKKIDTEIAASSDNQTTTETMSKQPISRPKRTHREPQYLRDYERY